MITYGHIEVERAFLREVSRHLTVLGHTPIFTVIPRRHGNRAVIRVQEYRTRFAIEDDKVELFFEWAWASNGYGMTPRQLITFELNDPETTPKKIAEAIHVQLPCD